MSAPASKLARRPCGKRTGVWLLGACLLAAGSADAAPSARAAALKEQGDKLAKAGKKKEAATSYKKAVFFDSSYVQAHHAYQDVMSDLGKTEQATRYYRRLLQGQGDRAVWHYLVGRITPDLAEKEAEFRKAIELGPSFEWGHYALAYLLENRGRREEAISEFQKALRVRPKWAAAWVGIGFARMNQNKNQDAVAAFKKAIELNPGEIDAYVNQGYVYRRLERYEDVVSVSKKGLTLFADNPWLCNNLGSAYYRLGLYSQSVKQFKIALRQPEYDTPEIAHLNLAFTYRRQGKLILAAMQCREAIQIRPNFAYAHNCLAQVLYHRKKYDEARQHVEKAQALGWSVRPEFLADLKRASQGAE